MLQYLTYSILFQLVFLLTYELLLKKETFFTYNRLYLLLTPIASLLLPLVHFEGLSDVVPSETLVFLPEVVVGRAAEAGEVSVMDTNGSSSINFLPVLYCFGVLGSILIFIRKFRILKHLFQNYVVSEGSGLRIIEVSNSKIACTFFSTVFLGDQLSNEQREQILSHELVHVTQKHSYDLLYFEIFRILFWFNPLIYIYQAKISALHEFMADAGVVRTVEKKTYYQQLLNTAFNTEDISFINQFFNQSLIKKRIVMLQKSQSRSIAKLKFLVLLPVVFCMLCLVSQSYAQESDTQLVINVVDVENLTTLEQQKVEEALASLEKGALFTEVAVSDGSSKTYYSLNKKTGKMITSKVTRVPSSGREIGDVPFSLIEEVPLFPGCEDLSSNELRKNCMTEKITAHVMENFNTKVAKDLSLEGIQKIYVLFKIDQQGNPIFVDARAQTPELEKEAERVIKILPKMEPGKQRGKAVAVLYSLPIQFDAPEKRAQ